MKLDVVKLKAALVIIEHKKVVLAKIRDEVRSLHNDIDDLLESCDVAVSCFEAGLRDMQDGIDALSEHI